MTVGTDQCGVKVSRVKKGRTPHGVRPSTSYD
jgi:hypothetical protein